MRQAAAWFLLLQGGAALLWWGALLLWPAAQRPFLFPGAPQSVLLAFFVPDLLLFVGAAWLAAWGLKTSARWAWGALCLHAGAVGYATLFCWSLALMQGGGWTGALAMTLSMAITLGFAWRLRPVAAPANENDEPGS